MREEQEECETKLEKERDIWAAEMFELIAEEENMASYIVNYIKYQQLYYRSALDEIENVMGRVNGFISKILIFFFEFFQFFVSENFIKNKNMTFFRRK